MRRRAEIGEQHLTGLGAQYIGGLEVSMHHTRIVRGAERVQQGHRDGGGFLHGEAALFRDALLQRLPADQAHHNPRQVILDHNIVDRHDIRMITQPGRGARLTLGQGQPFGSFGMRSRRRQADFFDGHVHTQQSVTRFPYPAESADPQKFDQSVSSRQHRARAVLRAHSFPLGRGDRAARDRVPHEVLPTPSGLLGDTSHPSGADTRMKPTCPDLRSSSPLYVNS
nr:hypothetical protein [Nocardia sp.]